MRRKPIRNRDQFSLGLRAGERPFAFTVLEVLVSLAILSMGILVLLSVFPNAQASHERAELRTIGSLLALQKIEEVRRDNDVDDKLLDGIRNLTRPNAPTVFAAEPRLAWRFSGVSVLYADRGASDPRAAPGVARVLIQFAPGFRDEDTILDEFRFN